MSTNRRSRIITVLARQQPLSIISLTNIVNEDYSRDYTPSLVGRDVKALISDNLVRIDEEKRFLLTENGIVCFEMKDQYCEGQTEN